MFGKLKKRLGEVVKKFTGEGARTEEKEIEETKTESRKELHDIKKHAKEIEFDRKDDIIQEQLDEARSAEQKILEDEIKEKDLQKEIKELAQQEKEDVVLTKKEMLENEEFVEGKDIVDDVAKEKELREEIEELVKQEKEDITIKQEEMLENEKILEKEREIEHKEDVFEEKKLEYEEFDKNIEEIDKKLRERSVREEELFEERREETQKETKEQIKEEVREEKKKSIFGRIFSKVTEKKLEEDEINAINTELKKALLENDVAYEVAERICKDVKEELLGKTIKRGSAEDLIKESLKKAMLDVMQHDAVDLEPPAKRPFTILFLGFNGTGKTTTIAKVAHMLKKRNSVIFAAGDTFRAASIEQIEEHGRRLGVSVIKHKYGSDSAAVVFDAVKHAKASGIDFVLADTAGRSHSNVNLMDELKKVVRVNNPDMKILVLDSLTGNDIYEQARLFNDAVGVDAIILTKADVYEKGGAALSASYTIKKPIIFLGTGQEYEDLKYFDPKEVVKNLIED